MFYRNWYPNFSACLRCLLTWTCTNWELKKMVAKFQTSSCHHGHQHRMNLLESTDKHSNQNLFPAKYINGLIWFSATNKEVSKWVILINTAFLYYAFLLGLYLDQFYEDIQEVKSHFNKEIDVNDWIFHDVFPLT